MKHLQSREVRVTGRAGGNFEGVMRGCMGAFMLVRNRSHASGIMDAGACLGGGGGWEGGEGKETEAKEA